MIGCDLVVTREHRGDREDGAGAHARGGQRERHADRRVREEPELAAARARTCRATSAKRRRMRDFVAATELASALMGDAIATNMFMLGYA